MTNSLIPSNSFFDDLCNSIILYSSDLANRLHVSYSELWDSIMFLIPIYIIYNTFITLLALYFPFRLPIKIIFWISNIIIFGLLIIIFFDYLKFMLYFN